MVCVLVDEADNNWSVFVKDVSGLTEGFRDFTVEVKTLIIISLIVPLVITFNY